MDARLARAEDVMSSQRARAVAGKLKRSSRVRVAAPARCPFSLLLSLWARKEKEGYNTKNFFNPLSTTSPSNEERFCVSTLEKEGTKI